MDVKHDPLALRLYRSHRGALVDYAGRLAGDRASAEDIVQDAWIRFDRHPEPDALREPLGYLKRIVRNLVIDRARRRAFEGVQDGAFEIVSRIAADDAPMADEAMVQQDEVRLVLSVIDGLPARQRAAIRMYHFEGLKLREIADRLGISRSLAHLLVKQGLELCDQRREEGR